MGGADAPRRRRARTAGSTSPAPSAARSAATSTAIKLDGTGLERLSTDGRARTTPTFSPRFALLRRLVERRHDADAGAAAPGRRRAKCASSTRTRSTALAEYRLSKPEFLQVKTRDGFVMEAMMIKPPDFDPSKRYPVYQFTYGGPHAPAGAERLGRLAVHVPPAARAARHHRLDLRQPHGQRQGRRVRRGRCTSNFGELELRDIEDGVALAQAAAVRGRHRASASTAGATAAS